MIPARRFDANLDVLLSDLADDAPAPDYVEDVLLELRSIRQRPAWSFPGRRLPFDPALVLAVVRPSRAMIVAALVLIALAAALVAVGSLRRPPLNPLPPPFGPAGNGLLVFDRDGDLWTHDLGSGTDRLLLGSSEADSQAAYLPDGTHVTFIREIAGEPWLMVATATGSDVHRILDRPALGVLSGAAAPDSRSLAIVSDLNGRPRLSIHPLTGTSITTLDLGMDVTSPVYRPPDGRRIAFRGVKDGAVDLYLVDPDGANLQPLHVTSRELSGEDSDSIAPAWSPDGRFLAYSTVDPGPGTPRATIHVLDVDAGVDRLVPSPPNADQAWALWSPDGRWMSVQRWEPGGTGRFAVVPSDGSSVGIEVDLGTPVARGPWIATWSPDGRQLLEWLDRDMGLIAVDPGTGAWHRLDWVLDGPPDWQRVAP